MIRLVRFWFNTAIAIVSVLVLAIVYAVVLIVMYFPRSPEEDEPDEI